MNWREPEDGAKVATVYTLSAAIIDWNVWGGINKPAFSFGCDSTLLTPYMRGRKSKIIFFVKTTHKKEQK